MSSLNNLTKEEYNDEPVYFCAHCLSLKVKTLNGFLDYCEDCGGTDIETIHIDNWKSLYKERYHKEFLEIKNGREEEKSEAHI